MSGEREQPGVEDPTSADEDAQDETSAASVIGGIALLAGLIGLAVWLISSIAPDEVPTQRNPDFIDTIFASPIVIAAARIVLLSAAVVLLVAGLYIMASIAVRISRGQWLRRAGPFESELAEAAESLEEASDFFDQWIEALDENEELVQRLEERDAVIEQLLTERQSLVEEIEKFR